MTDNEIMHDFDEDKHGDRYCNKQKCRACNGIDENGEPNGYGCVGRDEYIQSRYDSILKNRKKRLTNAST
jgi:hypothetical protein